MKLKKNIVRILVSFFGLIFILAFIYSLSFGPVVGNSLVDISGFSTSQDIEFKTAGLERFFYEKAYEISGKEFSILNQDRDVGILVYRMPGYYYEIELNGKTVGKVSDVQHKGSNIWNNAYVFVLDHENIKDENVLKIRGESASVFNVNMFKVYLGRYDKVSKIYTTQRVLFQHFLVLVSGFLIALGIAITLFKASDDYGEKGYIWMAIGSIFFGFYLFDYIEFWSLPISKLLFRKVTILCLFLGIGFLGVGLAKRFHDNMLKKSSIVLIILGIMVAFAAYTFPSFKKLYSYATIAFLVQQVLICMTFFKMRKNIEFGHTLLFISGMVIVTTSYDVYGMINNLSTAKMSIYSVVVLISSILVISIYHLSDDYQSVQENAVNKEKEVTALMDYLYKDKLSGYRNFEYLQEQRDKTHEGVISVAFSRFDALEAIKNNRGLEISEKLLLETYKIYEQIFTSFGDFFVDGKGQVIIVLEGIHTEDAFKMLEMARLKVMQSEVIRELCGFLPYTITSGIATRIEDETLKELIRRANLAMLNGEGHGRNQTTIFKMKYLENGSPEQQNHSLMLNFVYTIINTIDSRDQYTSRHSEEVAKYSVLIGEKLGLDEEHINALKIGAMLHDCGKLGVSDFILNKVEPLTDEENRIIKNHPIVGYQLTKQIFKDVRVLNCIKNHHERYDGNGYPDQLEGSNIPLEARIVAVADAYHAMISSRKYGKVYSHEMAFKELSDGVNKQFDKGIVAAFSDCFNY